MISILGFVLMFLESSFIHAFTIPALFHRNPLDASSLPPSKSTVQLGLGPRLSRGASLYFPNSPEFANYTERWSATAMAEFAVVVVAAVDRDVAESVKFANIFNVPFLATNMGHGTAAGLSTVHSGLSIDIHPLDSIEIAKDGKSALMGGGTYVDQAIRAFASVGKASSSGACGCVGMMGPGLGGGFGRYQGYFGLVADNIIDMNVVIADGSSLTVSATSHSDLFWAMRGAGHNFGIVTRFNYKIHDAPVTDWFFATLIFTQDKLEEFFELSNDLGANGKQDQRIVLYTLFALNPEVPTHEPFIIMDFEFAGPESDAAPFLAPFIALDPVALTNVTTPYTNLAHASASGVTDPVCQFGGSKRTFPVGLLRYNVTTNRALYELFSKMLADHPGLNNSIVQFEGYSMQGVQAVDPASTAYAHREDNLLFSFATFYGDPRLDQIALTYGKQARALIRAGDVPAHPFNTYVNYASSDETPEQNYGYDPWRLAKLRSLKSQYDPHGRFNFYNPINE